MSGKLLSVHGVRLAFLLCVFSLPMPVFAQAQTVASMSLEELTEKGFEADAKGNVSLAISLLGPAAERGHAKAQSYVAYYLQKSGRSKEAYDWYNRAAEQGYLEAMHLLGSMLVAGVDEVAADPQRAVALFTKAAELGYLESMQVLAKNYELGGMGLAVDYGRSLFWYAKAARAGDKSSMSRLARAYELGEMGQTVDADIARQWKAMLDAEQENTGAK